MRTWRRKTTNVSESEGYSDTTVDEMCSCGHLSQEHWRRTAPNASIDLSPLDWRNPGEGFGQGKCSATGCSCEMFMFAHPVGCIGLSGYVKTHAARLKKEEGAGEIGIWIGDFDGTFRPNPK